MKQHCTRSILASTRTQRASLHSFPSKAVCPSLLYSANFYACLLSVLVLVYIAITDLSAEVVHCLLCCLFCSRCTRISKFQAYKLRCESVINWSNIASCCVQPSNVRCWYRTVSTQA